jgi:RNA polymerase primary sigma factor
MNFSMKKGNRVSHVEEIELCKKAQSGSQKAMDHMVSSNLGLVSNIAKKFYYKNDQYSFDDLFQEGVIGLMKAIQKFDSGEGCRFSTYSYYWIYCYVSKYHTDHYGKIRIPSHIKDKIRKYEKDGDKRLDEVKSSVPVVVSLNKIIGESSTLEELVADEGERDFMEELDMIRGEMRKVLTEKEYDVLCHRYGIDGFESKTQRACAKIYGVSYTAIYLIEKKAIKKLKGHFNQ